jgi:hypothetical protein
VSDRSSVVLGYIPAFIADQEPIRSVLAAMGIDTGKMMDDVQDVLAQCFVDTATWGLKTWEQYLGIPVKENNPVSYRRSVIKAKLRGIGTTTKAKVQETAESFQNGAVEVIPVPGEYKVEIKFTEIYGTPPNIDDFQNAINQIIPAHLLVEFLYTYLTWQQLDDAQITWEDLDNAQFTWDEFERWNPASNPLPR